MKHVVTEIAVTDPLGIHARPAAALAVAIGRSGARVTLRVGEKSADGKSVIRLLALGAGHGSTVTAEIEGADAEVDAAIDALRTHLAPDAG